MAITPGMALGGLGLAGGLAGMFGGGGPGSVSIPGQQNNMAGATAGSIGGLGAYNLGVQFSPNVAGIAQGYMSNPYASGFQGAASQFGGAGQANALQALSNAQQFGGMAPGVAGTGGQFFGQIPNAMGAGNAILGTAFDPQQALYNRTAQQVSDQSLAGLSNAGLVGTPWGQGVQGNTMSNFNIDWQNQQLARQGAGIQGFGNAMGAAGGLESSGLGAIGAGLGLAGGAFGLGASGMESGMQAGAMPWNAYNQILAGQLQGPMAAAQYGNLTSQIPQAQAGDWLNYMSGMNSANQGAGQLGLQQQQQGFQQNQIYGQDIGKSLALMSGSVTPSQAFGWGGQVKPQTGTSNVVYSG